MDNLIIFGAKYLVFSLPLLLVWLWRKLPAHRLEIAISLTLTGLIALALIQIAGAIYDHPRPFAVKNIVPLVSHGNDNGFPSEHATYAASLAAIIYGYRRRWGIAAIGIAILVGISRVLADVHYPIDILAGLIIGAAAGCLAVWLARRICASLLAKNSVKKDSDE